MKAIRGIMTVYLLVVLVFALLGWRWISGDKPPPTVKKNLNGARVVLAVVAVSSLAGMGILWSAKPRKSH